MRKFFRPSSFVPLDPLRVVLADIASQRFIANADDVTRRILILTIATAVILLQAVYLYGVSLDIENYCTLGSFFDHQ